MFNCDKAVSNDINNVTLKNIESENDENSWKILLATEILLAILIITSATSTVYDFVTRQKENRSDFFLSFSVRRNVSSFFDLRENPSSETISCLFGIRSLSMISIIFFHAFVMRAYSPFWEQSDDWSSKNFALAISSFGMAVDSFFVMSAALFTKTMMTELKK